MPSTAAGLAPARHPTPASACAPDVSSMILLVGLPAPWPALTSMRVSSGLRCGESGDPAAGGKEGGHQQVGGTGWLHGACQTMKPSDHQVMPAVPARLPERAAESQSAYGYEAALLYRRDLLRAGGRSREGRQVNSQRRTSIKVRDPCLPRNQVQITPAQHVPPCPAGSLQAAASSPRSQAHRQS